MEIDAAPGALEALPDGPLICVQVDGVDGSAPRGAGTVMLVGADWTLGTIGGGALEWRAVARARTLLTSEAAAPGQPEAFDDVILGPDSGQCCGGRVRLRFAPCSGPDAPDLATLRTAARAQAEALPQVVLFGAGPVGRAIAGALLPLPLRVTLVDSRPEELALSPKDVAQITTPLPEAQIAQLRTGDGVVIATHDHGVDFLLAEAAISRGDLGYIGMIGSQSKAAQFTARARRAGLDPSALICPMGAAGLGDKRPAVIAAYVATEILDQLGRPRRATASSSLGA